MLMLARLSTSAFVLTCLALLGNVEAQVHKATRTAVIDSISQELERGYVYPAVGRSMADAIRARRADGAYDAITDATAFAATLTNDLRAISRDNHLRVAVRRPAEPPPATRPALPVIEGTEVLAGNVGYFKLNSLPPVSTLREPLAAVMRRLASTDALIIDLRDNTGGSPESAMLVAGYLMPAPTLVARIYSRQDDSTTEMRSGKVENAVFSAKPVYIVTSRRTFSAAEALAYHMKHVRKAVIVGEPSGGGAHRIRSVALPESFDLLLPFTRPINVVTGGDWEGTGVTPDVASSATLATVTAHVAALRALPVTEERTRTLAALERQIKILAHASRASRRSSAPR